MHFGTAEGFVVGVLTGGHLHQRRSGEEYLGAFLDHDHVVGHAGNVGTARGGVAEHEGDGGNSGGGQLRQVAEHASTGDEYFLLRGQIGATGFDE